MEMAIHELQPLPIGPRRSWFAGRLLRGQLGEDPRIEQSAAADGHAGAAGETAHVYGVVHRSHIAVAEDGNALDRLDHGTDAVEVYPAAKSLSAGAAVDGHRGHAGFLELPREERGAQIVLVPTEAHLDRHGDADALDDAANQGDGVDGIA